MMKGHYGSLSNRYHQSPLTQTQLSSSLNYMTAAGSDPVAKAYDLP